MPRECRLDQAGVKVIAYSDGRERKFTTPMDKMLRSISAFADEQERDRARQRTHDAMMKKAMQKHVTGGRVFGYDNVPVYASGDRHGTGDPVYKVREINEGEAAIVRRMFEMIGEGYGLKAVAKRLNDDGVPRPRPSAIVHLVGPRRRSCRCWSASCTVARSFTTPPRSGTIGASETNSRDPRRNGFEYQHRSFGL